MQSKMDNEKDRKPQVVNINSNESASDDESQDDDEVNQSDSDVEKDVQNPCQG